MSRKKRSNRAKENVCIEFIQQTDTGKTVQLFFPRKTKIREALPSDKELWATSAAEEGVRRCNPIFALERKFDSNNKDG